MLLRERKLVWNGLAAAAFVLSACPAGYPAGYQGPPPSTAATPSTPSSAPAQSPAAASSAAPPPAADARPIAGQAAKLLALATQLKMEVDKTNKNILSIPVIDKAQEIEKLARKMREGSAQGSAQL